MCSPPSACTATTPRCRCWPRARRSPAGSGPMCATTGRSPGRSRRRRCSATPATARRASRSGTWPATPGILQADAYAGFNELYAPGRKPGPITEAACWAHGRRKFFELAEVAKARRSRAEAVRRIDAIFAVERAINGLPAEQRLAVRQRHDRAARRRPRDLDARASAPACRAMPRSPRRWTTC